jgi:molybdopterin molybdotransferase
MSLLSVEEAQRRIAELTIPLSAETVDVDEGLGRVLVREVLARRTLPPFDNAAMDGYAARASDLAEGARELEVIETIHAGARPTRTIETGTCARVMTGAPLPPGADCVVMQERTERKTANRVLIQELPSTGQHIRKRGEDIAAGMTLLAAQTTVGVAEAAALWAQGLSTIEVHRRPRVAIASSGDELCDVTDFREDKIVDTNTPSIAALVKLAGAQPHLLGRSPDSFAALKECIAPGLTDDVLLTVSGASVGERDFAKEALTSLGVELDFWKVAMKPGKPLAVGKRNHTLVFCLPGNPISAMVSFELFVRPALRRLAGHRESLPKLTARLEHPLRKPAGLRHFLRAQVEWRGSECVAIPLSSQSSGAFSSAIGATHLISLAPDVTHLAAGSMVELIPLSWGT